MENWPFNLLWNFNQETGRKLYRSRTFFDFHDLEALQEENLILTKINGIYDLVHTLQYETANFEQGCPFTRVLSSSVAELQVPSAAAISRLTVIGLRFYCLIRMYWKSGGLSLQQNYCYQWLWYTVLRQFSNSQIQFYLPINEMRWKWILKSV